MTVLTATVEQMIVLFSLILMGYIVAKVKVVPINSAIVLSKLENNLFIPALVLGTFVENFTLIYTYGLAFSDFGFIGNAVVSAVFPEIFLEYLIFTMPLWTMIYLWGVPYLLIPFKEEKLTIKTRLKSFANPMFIAMVLGIVIGLCGLKWPGFLSTAVSVTGSCMSPIAMLLIGITIANMDVKKILSIKSIYVVSIIRLFVFPLILLVYLQFVQCQKI